MLSRRCELVCCSIELMSSDRLDQPFIPGRVVLPRSLEATPAELERWRYCSHRLRTPFIPGEREWQSSSDTLNHVLMLLMKHSALKERGKNFRTRLDGKQGKASPVITNPAHILHLFAPGFGPLFRCGCIEFLRVLHVCRLIHVNRKNDYFTILMLARFHFNFFSTRYAERSTAFYERQFQWRQCNISKINLMTKEASGKIFIRKGLRKIQRLQFVWQLKIWTFFYDLNPYIVERMTGFNLRDRNLVG